jgi:hypothetical protein
VGEADVHVLPETWIRAESGYARRVRPLAILLVSGCAGGTATVPPLATGADLTVPAAALEVCVNELMPANRTIDVSFPPSDWIELHDPGDADVLLDGWTLSDDRAEPDAASLDGLVVPAGGFLVLLADDAELPFTLADDGEEVVLTAPDGRASVVRYGPVEDDVALARATDCCEDCIERVWRGTPGRSNE